MSGRDEITLCSGFRSHAHAAISRCRALSELATLSTAHTSAAIWVSCSLVHGAASTIMMATTRSDRGEGLCYGGPSLWVGDSDAEWNLRGHAGLRFFRGTGTVMLRIQRHHAHDVIDWLA